MGARVSDDRRARILIDAMYMGEKDAAKKHGVSIRSIMNWKKELGNDSEFSTIFRKYANEREKSWADEIPAALEASINFLKSAANEASPKNADVIKAISGATQVLSDVAITKDIIDARIAGTDRAENEETR